MNQTFKHVLSDQEIDELKQRNAARLEEAQKRLGRLWVMAATRFPESVPANVAPIHQNQKAKK